MPILTVLIVDDEKPVLRAWERALVQGGHDVHAAASFEEGVKLLTDLQTIHVALLDLILPGASGEALYDTLRRVHPSSHAAIVSAFFDEERRQRLHARKIRTLDKPLNNLAQLVVDLWRQPDPRSEHDVRPFAEAHGLPDRETDIAQLLAAGCCNIAAIAHQLNRSCSTVNTHLQSIYKKTNTHSLAELLAKIHSFTSLN